MADRNPIAQSRQAVAAETASKPKQVTSRPKLAPAGQVFQTSEVPWSGNPNQPGPSDRRLKPKRYASGRVSASSLVATPL